MHELSVVEREQETIPKNVGGVSAAMGQTIATMLLQSEDNMDTDAEEEEGGRGIGPPLELGVERLAVN